MASKTSSQRSDVYAHLVDLGLTKRAAGAISADLHDLAEGITVIERALLSVHNPISPGTLQDARFEIELHLRGHLTSLNAELRSLQRRNPAASRGPRDVARR